MNNKETSNNRLLIEKFLIPFIKSLAYLISIFFSYKLLYAFSYLKMRVVSNVYKRQFKSCGKNFYLESEAILKGTKNITIGANFFCYKRLRLEAYSYHRGEYYDPQIVIGDNVSLNYDCHIGSINKIVIGNNVLIASKVYITDHYHGQVNSEALNTPPAFRKLFSPGPVVIEDNVWIGENVTILPNVTIGKNAIIGANSVVTSNIPSNAVAVGAPAKVSKVL